MIYNAIQTLIEYGVKNGLITEDDVTVVRNQLLDALSLSDWDEGASASELESIEKILAPIIDYACDKGIISDTTNSRDLFDTKIMGILTAMPREVISEFNARYEHSPKEATDWYYSYSQKINYVRAERIARDLVWTHETEYGTLDVTINRSKPEKDPRDIAAAKLQKASGYPKCQLCSENAGYAGHATHPARQNLRPVPISVGGEKWELQYSPYGYYNEHCIVFNKNHIPMKIDRSVFGKLFDIVDRFPHYFVGSNADLPIVGGSILSHEHFQGGRYTFAMEKAEIERTFELSSYPSVKAGIVKWPMSVIRLSSENREELEKACDFVLTSWRGYSDPEAYVFAETDGVPHNTVTPIARKKGTEYVCDLVLRNNITTEERPLGVFHPNPELHHIKKENIGLIEVMGLAVLPARLANELAELEGAIVNGEEINSGSSHYAWVKDVISRHPELNAENARYILDQEVGEVFLKVLLDAGVFKRNAEGKAAFDRFISHIR
ncbi:MAG: UDP-glucose--hexose-1-phosphate uridylyltransferase [Clostridia bacterium]|nr:UDP-glucose--hexose-1-phosphate uridylyltransferase [Clostridia bacterium]